MSLAIGAACLTAEQSVDAAQATGNMLVGATIISACVIVPGALAFGNYDPVSSNASTGVDAQAQMLVTCTTGANGLSLGAGVGAHASGTQRRMVSALSATTFLKYDLYSDSTRNTPLGSTVGTDTKSIPDGTGLVQFVDVYGRIPANQTGGSAGIYSDTVQMQLNY